jgi:ABC-type multidrug transport system ATPase subunit
MTAPVFGGPAAWVAAVRFARLSAELLVGRKAAVLLVGDGLLCFLFLILILTGGEPSDLHFITLVPLLVVGIPVMADAVGVERRSGTLDLALCAPAGPLYFFVRVSTVCVLFGLQGTVLLLSASMGIQRFHVFPAIAQCWLAAAVSGAVALAWATVLTRTGPALLASLLTVAAIGKWFLFSPVFGDAVPAFGRDGWLWRWLPSLTILTLVAVAAIWIAWRRLHQPELLVTGTAVRREPEPQGPTASVSVPQRPSGLSIRAEAVGKDFLGRTALREISIALTPGITGLLGANGAGKTTLIRILIGLLEPTRGSVSYHGVGAERISSVVGFLPQDFLVYPGLSAVEFLEYWALQRGFVDVAPRRKEVCRVLEAVGLTAKADRSARHFSGGMRQRIGLARAVLGSPPVLILDEPSSSLDLCSREMLRSVLLEYADRGIVLLSTHIASDLEAVASRLVHIERGCLRFDGPVRSFLKAAEGEVFELEIPATALPSFRRELRVVSARRLGDRFVVRALGPAGSSVPGARPVKPTLEEAYLARTAEVPGSGGERHEMERRLAFLGSPLGPIVPAPPLRNGVT